MSDYTMLVYAIDGREFKTVTGLFKYLMRKHDAEQLSAIGSDRVLRVYRSKEDDELVARYTASKPEIGKPITLTLL